MEQGENSLPKITFEEWKKLNDGQNPYLFVDEGRSYLAECAQLDGCRDWVKREREQLLSDWLDRMGVPATAEEIANPSHDAQWLLDSRTPENRDTVA